jgi:rhodanese-related sulfurtransferase
MQSSGERRAQSVEELLDTSRSTLRRVTPTEAQHLSRSGALMVDIRPSEQRSLDGTIPGALVIDRNVLEWRLDPASANRIPDVTSYEQGVIVVCNEGYASSLAAASLQALGLRNATDLIGGIQAWKAAGLPIDPPR